MRDYCDYIHGRLNCFPKDWKSRVHGRGLPIYRTVAERFAGTGPDFAPLPAAFDRAFIPE